MTTQLGFGTIGIGRPWPTEQHDVPSSAQVAALLERAVSSGIRFFDTVPAYGLSEARLGQVQHKKLASTARNGRAHHWSDRNSAAPRAAEASHAALVATFRRIRDEDRAGTRAGKRF
ncbi:aldo/keto reductase [Streptomyces lavendulae]|uniref:aldo/keto reductase n=1 Tax=Streptomyces lavendulae TaxID=1914 RepID=UPI0036A3389C